MLREFEQKNDNPTRWPWWGQLILAIVALATACGLLIVIPAYIAPKAIVGGAKVTNLPFTTLVVVFIGLTTMTISAMFLFMTFRIDRGTKATAERVAQKVAEDKVTDDAVDQIRATREIGEKAKERIEEARDEAEALIAHATEEARKGVEETTRERVASMVQTAGRKIDEADIEKLVNARLDALLEQADGWPRRLFPRFRRRREPNP